MYNVSSETGVLSTDRSIAYGFSFKLSGSHNHSRIHHQAATVWTGIAAQKQDCLNISNFLAEFYPLC